jgi:hypothetical protein
MKGRIHWLLGVFGVLSMLHAPSSNAARAVGTTASTGLLSLTPGHVAIVTLADVGSAKDAVVAAELEILDGGNRILASTRGELGPGQPLELEVRDDVVTGSRLPVRARVVVFDGGKRPARGLRPRRVLTFEVMNSSTGDIALVTLGPICFPGGGGFEFNCEGDLFLTGEPTRE